MKKKIEVEENKKLNIGEIHISSNGITLITLVITIILHYYYGMKYSNSNGFLKAII